MRRRSLITSFPVYGQGSHPNNVVAVIEANRPMIVTSKYDPYWAGEDACRP